jgi:hypothetical protein
VADFVAHYNQVRLHSAIGYVAPADKLAGRETVIFAEVSPFHGEPVQVDGTIPPGAWLDRVAGTSPRFGLDGGGHFAVCHDTLAMNRLAVNRWAVDEGYFEHAF